MTGCQGKRKMAFRKSYLYLHSGRVRLPWIDFSGLDNWNALRNSAENNVFNVSNGVIVVKNCARILNGFHWWYLTPIAPFEAQKTALLAICLTWLTPPMSRSIYRSAFAILACKLSKISLFEAV